MRGYRIDSGIPIPPLARARQGGLTDTFRKMKKGQSVRLKKQKYRSATSMAGKLFGSGNYEVRSNGSHFRLWRTK